MTDPQQNEKKTDKAFRALKESEQLYKAVLRTSPDAIQITDLKGKIIEVSEKSLILTGAENAEDLIGSLIINFVPRPSILSTTIFPLCLLTIISCETLSPSPVPFPTGFVVKNGSKILLAMSSGIPGPLSNISQMTWSDSA